jgi:hypothetical protein
MVSLQSWTPLNKLSYNSNKIMCSAFWWWRGRNTVGGWRAVCVTSCTELILCVRIRVQLWFITGTASQKWQGELDFSLQISRGTHTVSGCTVQCTLCILFVVHTTHWEIFMCTFSTHTHTNTVWYLKRIHILSSSYASVKTAETTSINIQNEFFFWKLFGLFLNFYVFFWTLIFSLSVLVFK